MWGARAGIIGTWAVVLWGAVAAVASVLGVGGWVLGGRFEGTWILEGVSDCRSSWIGWSFAEHFFGCIFALGIFSWVNGYCMHVVRKLIMVLGIPTTRMMYVVMMNMSHLFSNYSNQSAGGCQNLANLFLTLQIPYHLTNSTHLGQGQLSISVLLSFFLSFFHSFIEKKKRPLRTPYPCLSFPLSPPLSRSIYEKKSIHTTNLHLHPYKLQAENMRLLVPCSFNQPTNKHASIHPSI